MTTTNPVIPQGLKKSVEASLAPKHPGSICVANYKGGVGKTTVSCLLGYYLATKTHKKVLLVDIDPQCSLSLAVGFDPETVSKNELTVYNLVMPTNWTNAPKTNSNNYAVKVPDSLSPSNLSIIKGSFNVDTLDLEIANRVAKKGDKSINEFYSYCKQMLNAFDDYSYIIVDCPPNKMYLTQGMLRACSFYLSVTIPDAISVYGMPRLQRWVREIDPPAEKPKLLGCILNALNRAGGAPQGMVVSQQSAQEDLKQRMLSYLDDIERAVIGAQPIIGVIPRLDVIARFLGQRGAKFTRDEFSRRTSGQQTVDECLRNITNRLLQRLGDYSKL